MGTQDRSVQAGEAQTGRTISLSERGRQTLEVMTRDTAGLNQDIPLFASFTEAMRFACMLGLRANGDQLVPMSDQHGQTIINIGSLDPEEGPSFVQALSKLAPKAIQQEKLTRVVRRYCEWGLEHMQKWYEQADEQDELFDMLYLFKRSEELVNQSSPAEKG